MPKLPFACDKPLGVKPRTGEKLQNLGDTKPVRRSDKCTATRPCHSPGQERCRSPVSRILSAPLARGWTVISLTPPRRSAPLARDATNTRRVTDGPPFPCSVLHHAGFAVPPRLPLARWALAPPFHPCLCPRGPSAVCFLLHFPSGSLATTVPCFHKARCPMVSGLSSSTLARTRDRPESGMPNIVRIPAHAKQNFAPCDRTPHRTMNACVMNLGARAGLFPVPGPDGLVGMNHQASQSRQVC